MNPWRGWDARLDRANEHLEVLRVEVDACLERHKNTITHSYDLGRGLYVYNLGQGNTPEYRLGVLVGEVAHSIRAALNHLAFALAPSVDFIQFPIFAEAGPKYSKALRSFLPEHRPELNRWQPHNAGKSAHDHPLWAIHRLDIVEKHQCVPTVPFGFRTGRPTFFGYDQERNAIIAVPAILGLPEPDLYPEVRLDVSLDPFPHATKLVPVTMLYEAYDYVRFKLIPSVERLLA